MDIKKDVETHLLWKIGIGEVAFWWDNWTGFGVMASFIHLRRASKHTKVNEFGTWNYDKLHNLHSMNVVNTIEKLEINGSSNDFHYWLPQPTGNFSTKFAWQLLRERKRRTLSSRKIWHKGIPIKISFFVKRLLQKNCYR